MYLLLLYSTILCSQADSLHSCPMRFWIRDCSFLLCVFEDPSKWCIYSAILAGCGLYHLKDFYTDSVAFPLAEVFKLHQEWQQTEHGRVSCVLGEYQAAWCCNYRQLTLFFVPGVVTVGSWWLFCFSPTLYSSFCFHTPVFCVIEYLVLVLFSILCY